jgi:hypothetical protein
MADRGKQQRKPDLSPDELTERLVSDPSQPPDSTVLTGFLGESSLDGHRRLYLDATLKSYVDIPEEDIVHRTQTGAEESPLGPSSTLWVRRGAQLQQTVVSSRQVQADFLQGDITGGLAAQGPGGGPAPPQPGLWPRQTWGFECDPWPRPSAVTCSQWCSFTERGPRCTLAGPRCGTVDGPRCGTIDVCEAAAPGLWPQQTWGFECDPWPRPSAVTCSHWCSFTERGPRCTLAGPRCRSVDICVTDVC